MQGTITTTVLNKNPDLDLIEAAAITANKSIDDFTRPLSEEQWIKWIKSEHSPIRTIFIRVTITGVSPRAVSHITRHKFGVEFYVSTRRPDRTEDPDKPYTISIVGNPQAFVNIARRRLCSKAHDDVFMLVNNIKMEWSGYLSGYSDSNLLPAISACMVADCDYRGGCREFSPCGKKWWDRKDSRE